jgi:AcrR family transcriptional regulator
MARDRYDPVVSSNNQRVKRAQIIDAAKEVLATHGLAACTARAVADASPLTKSAIHYYFHDINEIVDEAMAGHVDAMLANLRRAADQDTDPDERLWRMVEAYLATFAEQPHAAFLWFEYWVASSRRESLGAAAGMLDQLHALLVEILAETAVPDPDETAHQILSWLLGTIVQQHVRPRPPDTLRRELDRITSASPE